MSAAAIVGTILGAEPVPVQSADLAEFWRATRDARRAALPADRAVRVAFAADRLGFAFAGGYHAALAALCPELGPDAVTCLAATEDGGAHPRAIHARLTRAGAGWHLVGHKRWSTLGSFAASALVVASTGEEAGRNRLRVARVALDAPGVRVTAMPATPFVPEIPHASLELDLEVDDSALLPGDGYTRYLKPFRTIEDLHVHLALFGYFTSVARRAGAERELLEKLAALVVGARALTLEDPLAPGTHLALAGVLASSRELVPMLDECFSRIDAEERARWLRDRPLLAVAEKARLARREAAWASVRAEPSGN